MTFTSEDVAQLVAREVRDVPRSAIPAEWTRASRWEIRRVRAVALVGEVADEGLAGGSEATTGCDRR